MIQEEPWKETCKEFKKEWHKKIQKYEDVKFFTLRCRLESVHLIQHLKVTCGFSRLCKVKIYSLQHTVNKERGKSINSKSEAFAVAIFFPSHLLLLIFFFSFLQYWD
jgi:hypothetical protein